MKVCLVNGVGINDVDYMVREWEYTGEVTVRGVKKTRATWVCPYYTKWVCMLERCYSKKYQEKNLTYKGCTVCKEWLTFSNFRLWCVDQIDTLLLDNEDWWHNQLDKDYLILGNQVYSPEACVFIHPKVNSFMNNQQRHRGEFLIGCYWDAVNSKFKSSCRNPFTGKNESLGRYKLELCAHLMWKSRKHELACMLADSNYVTDERIRQVLLNKYK